MEFSSPSGRQTRLSPTRDQVSGGHRSGRRSPGSSRGHTSGASASSGGSSGAAGPWYPSGGTGVSPNSRRLGSRGGTSTSPHYGVHQRTRYAPAGSNLGAYRDPATQGQQKSPLRLSQSGASTTSNGTSSTAPPPPDAGSIGGFSPESMMRVQEEQKQQLEVHHQLPNQNSTSPRLAARHHTHQNSTPPLMVVESKAALPGQGHVFNPKLGDSPVSTGNQCLELLAKDAEYYFKTVKRVHPEAILQANFSMSDHSGLVTLDSVKAMSSAAAGGGPTTGGGSTITRKLEAKRLGCNPDRQIACLYAVRSSGQGQVTSGMCVIDALEPNGVFSHAEEIINLSGHPTGMTASLAPLAVNHEQNAIIVRGSPPTTVAGRMRQQQLHPPAGSMSEDRSASESGSSLYGRGIQHSGDLTTAPTMAATQPPAPLVTTAKVAQDPDPRSHFSTSPRGGSPNSNRGSSPNRVPPVYHEQSSQYRAPASTRSKLWVPPGAASRSRSPVRSQEATQTTRISTSEASVCAETRMSTMSTNTHDAEYRSAVAASSSGNTDQFHLQQQMEHLRDVVDVVSLASMQIANNQERTDERLANLQAQVVSNSRSPSRDSTSAPQTTTGRALVEQQSQPSAKSRTAPKKKESTTSTENSSSSSSSGEDSIGRFLHQYSGKHILLFWVVSLLVVGVAARGSSRPAKTPKSKVAEGTASQDGVDAIEAWLPPTMLKIKKENDKRALTMFKPWEEPQWHKESGLTALDLALFANVAYDETTIKYQPDFGNGESRVFFASNVTAATFEGLGAQWEAGRNVGKVSATTEDNQKVDRYYKSTPFRLQGAYSFVNTQFVTLWNEGTKHLVIAWRGTSSVEDSVDDARFSPIPWTAVDESLLVHSGFSTQYDAARDEIHTILKRYLATAENKETRKPTLKLSICGHSLGGALTTLSALDLQLTFGDQLASIDATTFGSPRVGTRDTFVAKYRATTPLEERTLRLANMDPDCLKSPIVAALGFTACQDKVSLAPPAGEILKYEHVTAEPTILSQPSGLDVHVGSGFELAMHSLTSYEKALLIAMKKASTTGAKK